MQPECCVKNKTPCPVKNDSVTLTAIFKDKTANLTNNSESWNYYVTVNNILRTLTANNNPQSVMEKESRKGDENELCRSIKRRNNTHIY